jgi:outer membrane protein TolC
MIRRTIAALLLLLPLPLANPLRAEPPAPLLTLHQAIELAERQNQQIAAAEARSRAAEAGWQEGRSGRLPRIELVETVSYTTNPVLVFSNKLGQEAFTLEDFQLDNLNRPAALSNFNTQLAIRQPIWTGGQVKHGAEAARLGFEATAAGAERTRQEVKRQVIDAYSNAVLAASQLAAARESLETARANVRLVRDLRETGMVVEADLLQARVRETEVQELVLRAEAAVAVSRAALNLALGRDLQTPYRLPPAVSIPAVTEEALPELIQEASRERPDLQAAATRVEALRAAARAQGGGNVEVGLTGLAEANAENFIGADGTNWSVILGARFTVFDGKGNGSRVRRAREEALAAARMREMLQQAIELEVHQAFHDLRSSRKRLEQAEQAVELAGESLRTVRDRYGEGLTTLVELLDVETALTRARTRSIAAQRDVLVSKASLDLAVGRL